MADTLRDQKTIRIVRMKQLKPFWGNRLNDRPGNGRWAVTPVGGPEGFLHMNRDDGAVVTETCTVGFMYFPVGVSSPGVHVHNDFDEVYVVTRGEMAVRFGDGSEELLSEYDCAFIPRGVTHGIRNAGLVEARLLWFQTGVEREGFQLGSGSDEGASKWLTEA